MWGGARRGGVHQRITALDVLSPLAVSVDLESRAGSCELRKWKGLEWHGYWETPTLLLGMQLSYQE